MNKNGFTLIELLAVLLIISFIMWIIFPSAKRVSDENKEKIYKVYEDMMIEYAKASDLNNREYIDLNDLNDLNKVKNDCDGYVTIDHNANPAVYKAYIKCINGYKTVGYNKPI